MALWKNEEIHTLFKLRNQGVDFSVIGKKIGRTTGACRKAYKKFQDIYPNIPTKEPAPVEYKQPRYSMCWLCQKACNGCKKPIKGWKATKEVNHESETFIIKECPEFEAEPWVEKYDCSEFFRNPQKVVKNGKTSRFKT